MAGFLPDEGETLVNNLLLKNADVDRGTDLELLLFTNSTGVDETITAAALTEPTGGGYARINLTDANWSSAGLYAKQTFTPTGADYTGSVYGAAIVTKGVTPRILSIEIDANGPYTMLQDVSHDITTSTFSQ